MEGITSTETLGKQMFEIGKICVPGMRLSESTQEFIAGPGTNEILGYIHASVAGVLKTKVDEKTKVTTIIVESPKTPSILPQPGDIITGRVTVVNPRLVYCVILCVNADVLTRPYKGIIRKEDIRLIDRDQTDPYKCFRPCDIILAKVLPMKEVHYYLLSTAENEFGVVIAKAEGAPLGVNMVPISWSEMQCPKTLVKEKRKVARVIPETLDLALHLVRENGDTTQDIANADGAPLEVNKVPISWSELQFAKTLATAKRKVAPETIDLAVHHVRGNDETSLDKPHDKNK